MARGLIRQSRRWQAILGMGALSACAAACSGEVSGPDTPGWAGSPSAPPSAGVTPGASEDQPGADLEPGPGQAPSPGASSPSAEQPTDGSLEANGSSDGPIEAAGPTTPEAPANPGNVIARRLNHSEYNNTVRDLLGTTLRPADDFLADDPGAGFDTVGAAASLSPAYVRDYEKAARALIGDLYADSARLSSVVTCDVEAEGASCAQSVITEFASRAFRRPTTAEEAQILLTPYQAALDLGASAEEGLRNSLIATLLSPHFIFKLEIDPDPTSTVARRLGDHELATRLSYALWSTMPDAELRAAADDGTLATDQGLAAQVERMLADPKIEALAEDFAAQWLHFRHLQTHEVAEDVFRDFDSGLAASMQDEAKLFFLEFLTGDNIISDMLVASFTFVDSALASHYGLDGPPEAFGQMQRVDTSGTERGGLLTLGSILTTTSYASRTSPVRRGQFVMDQLLCTTVPPPPPEVEGLPENDESSEVQDGLTMRERMEAHRQDPACFGCHQLMDPIGFGLENFDAIGRYRTEEGGLPIDSSGDLAGVEFSGASDLSTILAEDPRFVDCVAEKLMTFALGRFLNQADDATWIRHIAGSTMDQSGNLATMVRTLVMSEAFRSRQPSLPTAPIPAGTPEAN